ncbi:hypothetical protein FJTKL_02503 [Diaporthe vaccinii]|uniref:Uncharacterized protein n=1 Tax=Diaporthe vaccinii TaxID=105482 RepID=A0ABR4DYC2_9PEZI
MHTSGDREGSTAFAVSSMSRLGLDGPARSSTKVCVVVDGLECVLYSWSAYCMHVCITRAGVSLSLCAVFRGPAQLSRKPPS